MTEEQTNGLMVPSVEGAIVIYTSEDGRVRLDVSMDGDTVWLTQQQIGQLYGKATSTINEHIGNIFSEKELSRDACEKKFGNSEFQQKAPFYYNLDLIIAVGYRVRSQNKLHFATHGQTAAEVIFNRADGDKDFMGLTSFKGAHPTAADVTVAKNYLSETELRFLNNMVSGFFDFAENQAMLRKPMTMYNYRVLLDNILSANGAKVLDGPGSISAQQAREKALAEYRKYQVRELTPVERAYIANLQETAKQVHQSSLS